MTRGILIVSCDTDGLAEILTRSIQRHTSLPFHVHREPGKVGFASREVKLRMDQISPFDQTVFLDSDTIVASDPTPLFALLAHAPLWMCGDVGPRTVTEMLTHRFFKSTVSPQAMTRLKKLASRRPQAPHFNSGVVLFDKRATPLFEAWRTIWHELPQGPDQVALVLASAQTRLRPSLLSPRWNFQHSHSKPESDLVACRADIRILHLLGSRKPELYRRAKVAGYY